MMMRGLCSERGMVVVGGEEGGLVSYPYSCGWVLYIIFYLHVLYSGSHTQNAHGGESHMSLSHSW